MSEPAPAPAYVYLLRCEPGGTLYCGWTSDLPRRLRRHASGQGARYTRGRQVELVAALAMPDATAARREEARVKRLTRTQKLALVSASADDPAGSAVIAAAQPAASASSASSGA